MAGRNPNLTVPEFIAKLENVRFQEIEEPHDCYVPFPIPKPPQPCFIVVQHPGGAERWRDAVVVLPEDAPHSPAVRHPVYAAALGLIRSSYKKFISAVAEANFNELVEAGWESEPFLRAEPEGGLAAAVRSLTDDPAKISGPEMRKRLGRLLVKHCPDRKFWSPLKVGGGFTWQKAEEDWSILQSWADWSARGLDIEKCAAAFNARFGSSLSEDAFRKRLAYLGLKAARKLNRREKRQKIAIK